jgi:hypothetical protein
MFGRANDANADGSGNLVTGTLNIAAAPGGAWRGAGLDRVVDMPVPTRATSRSEDPRSTGSSSRRSRSISATGVSLRTNPAGCSR